MKEIDVFLYKVRRFTNRFYLARLVTTVRYLIHFGPWRALPRFLIRRLRPARHGLNENKLSLVGSLDTNAVVDEIKKNSFCIAGTLPESFVNELRSITDHLPVDHYQLMHRIDNNVKRIADDPAIKNVLRSYFKSEPVLLESTLLITGSRSEHGTNEQNIFHFDYAGWDSLNVFVYLTDVTSTSSYHIVAKGTHRNINIHDILRGSISEDEALRRFGASIQNIMGPAGTVFFENTEAFHRRYPGDERRVLLNLLYASHRNMLSHGRTGHDHIKYRDMKYNQARACHIQKGCMD